MNPDLVSLLVYVDSLHPSQYFFCHVGSISCPKGKDAKTYIQGK